MAGRAGASQDAPVSLRSVRLTPSGSVTREISLSKTTGVIRCDQPRTIDMGARSGKRLERIPDAVVNEVLARLEAILS